MKSSLATVVAWGYFILLAIVFILFYFGGSFAVIAGQEMHIAKAMFTTLNAGTLTGFQYGTAVDDLKAPGKLMIGLLTAGGILYSLIVGGTAAARILRLPYNDRQIAVSAVLITVLLTLLGGLLLGQQRDHPWYAGFFQALSAFGNSGVWIDDFPSRHHWTSFAILLPLAVIGGLGLPVLLEISRGNWRRGHASTTLLWSAGVFLGAMLILWLMIGPETLGRAAPWSDFLTNSTATAINTRNAGLPMQYTADFTRPAQRILMLLMLIGAGSAGTAGGLKVTTLAILFRGTRDTLLGINPGRIFGIALCWTGALLGVILLCYLNLLRTWPDMDADRLLMISISAATNCGLAHDKLSPSVGAYYSLSVTMLLGRILPVMVLWWTAQTTNDAELCAA